MNGLLILDKDSKTELSENLKTRILKILSRKGHRIEIFELGRNDAAPCRGCLHCLTKHPGECVSKDIVNDIIKQVRTYELTIFLTPVLFGHFSSSIKNAMDRGAGSHDLQIIIGFGSDIDNEEKSTFVDLISKHMGAADIVHPGMHKQVEVFVTTSIKDNDAICKALTNYI